MARTRNPKRAQRAESRAKAKVVATKPFQGFVDFIRERGVVGLAIGLAIGAQANATVQTIASGFINPIVAFLVGSQSGLNGEVWNVVGRDTETINYWFTLGNRTLVFEWGTVLASLITFTAVLLVIYLVYRVLNLDKLDKKK